MRMLGSPSRSALAQESGPPSPDHTRGRNVRRGLVCWLGAGGCDAAPGVRPAVAPLRQRRGGVPAGAARGRQPGRSQPPGEWQLSDVVLQAVAGGTHVAVPKERSADPAPGGCKWRQPFSLQGLSLLLLADFAFMLRLSRD